MSEVENKTEAEVVEKDTKAKDKKKKASKDRKPGFGTKLKNFFKNNKSELGKISWYGRKQTLKSTGIVIVVLLAVSVLIGLVDLGLSNLLLWIAEIL